MFIDICNIYILYNIHVSYLHRYQSSTHVCLRKVRLTCQALPGTSNFELCTRGQLEDLDQEILLSNSFNHGLMMVDDGLIMVNDGLIMV